MIRDEYDGLSLNDLGKLIRLDGKLMVKHDFNKIATHLYFLDGDIVELWLNTENGNVEKVENIWDHNIDPFLKYLEITTLN